MENNENFKKLSNPITFTKYLEKNTKLKEAGNWIIKDADKMPLLDDVNNEINKILSNLENDKK